MSHLHKSGVVFYGIKYLPSRGGTSRVAENLIRLLAKDYNIKIYCYKDKAASNYIENVKTYEIQELPFGNLGVFIYYFICAIHLLLFIHPRNIVHAHKTDCAFFLPLLRLKFKVIATSHEAPYSRDKWNSLGRIYFHLMERFFIHSGSLLTSISKPLADYYQNKYQKRVIYIPNGIEIDTPFESEKAKQMLNRYEVSEEFVLFAARRIMSTKGCHTMLEALYSMNYVNSVVIAGDESHAPDYIESLKQKYNSLNLVFLGYIDSLPLLMGLIHQTGLFIFPSETEGMSMMLLEVASSGTSIICSDIPENKQVFSKDEILYFKNKDTQDLKEKIEYALANPEVLKKKAAQAIQKINKKYKWTQIVKEYKSLYISLKK